MQQQVLTVFYLFYIYSYYQDIKKAAVAAAPNVVWATHNGDDRDYQNHDDTNQETDYGRL